MTKHRLAFIFPAGFPFQRILTHFLRKDGSIVWAIVHARPIFNERGTYTGSVRMLADITDRKAADARLRDSEARYATIFESAPYALALAHMPEAVLVEVNQAFLTLFEFTRAEVIGRTASELGILDEASRREALAQMERQRSLLCPMISDEEALCISQGFHGAHWRSQSAMNAAFRFLLVASLP